MSIQMNKLISVIVAVYNVEKYIERCIQSILQQTYSNWELILIDDGSIDNSGKICDKYSTNNKKIITFHTSNHGRSQARNMGIQQSNGEWIVFVDSDDFVGKKYLECMIKSNPNWNNETLISQGFHAILPNGEQDLYYPEALYNNIHIHTPATSDKVSQHSLLHRQAVWGRLFSKSIIEKYHISFHPQIHHSEDGLFLHQYMLHISDLKFISEQEYFYVTPTYRLNKINYEEIYYLAKGYQTLILSLIRYFNIKDSSYKKRIIDMYQARLGILLFDNRCPQKLKEQGKALSKTFIFHRPIQNIKDLKLTIKYLFYFFK